MIRESASQLVVDVDGTFIGEVAQRVEVRTAWHPGAPMHQDEWGARPAGPHVVPDQAASDHHMAFARASSELGATPGITFGRAGCGDDEAAGEEEA